MSIVLHLRIAGALLVALALMHAGFPRYFQWKQKLAGLDALQRQIAQVHTFFIALTVLLMGALCIRSPQELSSTPLGHTVLAGLAIFWGCRLVFQWLVYSPSLWRGRRFETFMHLLLSVLWVYLTAVFAFGAAAAVRAG